MEELGEPQIHIGDMSPSVDEVGIFPTYHGPITDPVILSP